MKAIELAKKLYPALSINDLTEICPDEFELIDKKEILCKDTIGRSSNKHCVRCWNQEVSQERVDWLIECKKMCDLLGC